MDEPLTPRLKRGGGTHCALSAHAALQCALKAQAPGGRAVAPAEKGVMTDDLAILNEWVWEVCDHRRLSAQSFHRAVWLAMRYVEAVPTLRVELQTVGCAAMLLASKVEEEYSQEAEVLADYTDGACTADEVVAAETRLLEALDFQVAQPTVLSMLGAFWRAHRLPDGVREAARFYVDLAVITLPRLCLAEPPSLVAAAAALAACQGSGGSGGFAWACDRICLAEAALLQQHARLADPGQTALRARWCDSLVNRPQFKAAPCPGSAALAVALPAAWAAGDSSSPPAEEVAVVGVPTPPRVRPPPPVPEHPPRVLGKGTYGTVAAGRTGGGAPAALKTFLPSDSDGLRDDAVREVSSLRAVGPHPGVVQLLQICVAGAAPVVALPLEEGTLEGWLREEKGQLPAGAAASLMRGLCQAVAHVHEHGVIHRDVSASNVLVRRADARPLLADFGSSQLAALAGGRTYAVRYVTTLWYRAPEISLDDVRNYSFPVDVWALGVLLLRLTSGAVPFPASEDTQQEADARAARARPQQPAAAPARKRRKLKAGAIIALEAGASETVSGGEEQEEEVPPAVGVLDPRKGDDQLSGMIFRRLGRPSAADFGGTLPESLLLRMQRIPGGRGAVPALSQDAVLEDLLRRLLAYDQLGRISARQAAGHAFLQRGHNQIEEKDREVVGQS